MQTTTCIYTRAASVHNFVHWKSSHNDQTKNQTLASLSSSQAPHNPVERQMVTPAAAPAIPLCGTSASTVSSFPSPTDLETNALIFKHVPEAEKEETSARLPCSCAQNRSREHSHSTTPKHFTPLHYLCQHITSQRNIPEGRE
jgi:hypothetical protein